MKNILHTVIGLILTGSVVIGEVVDTVQCTGKREQTHGVLEVRQIRIDPYAAPGDGKTKPCVIPRGMVGNISADFSPSKIEEDVARLDARLAYVYYKLGHLPFKGRDSNVCHGLLSDDGSGCPLSANKIYTWTAPVDFRQPYPTGRYEFKLKFTQGKERAKVFLCETFSVVLTKE